MILVPRADWPAWIVANYGDQPVLIGVPNDPADRTPGVFFMVQQTFFAAQLCRMNESCVSAYWHYPSTIDAVVAFILWATGKGQPDDKWIKHIDARTGAFVRRLADGRLVHANDDDIPYEGPL